LERKHRVCTFSPVQLETQSNADLRLKTHGVENRRRFSTSKIDSENRHGRKKMTTMLLLPQLCIYIVANRNKTN